VLWQTSVEEVQISLGTNISVLVAACVSRGSDSACIDRSNAIVALDMQIIALTALLDPRDMHHMENARARTRSCRAWRRRPLTASPDVTAAASRGIARRANRYLSRRRRLRTGRSPSSRMLDLGGRTVGVRMNSWGADATTLTGGATASQLIPFL
jgi:hypothetical protein